MNKLFEKIRDLLRDRRFRKIWVRTVSSIACLVVFVTTYALVLPAITMESEAECGIEVHQHDESCYEERLICDLPESEGHVHTDDCYSTTRKLICDRFEHLHTSDCYDEEGNLVCGQEEHQHGEDCFEETRKLVCGLEEAEGHSHDSSCYEKVLICGKEAHTHGPDCYREDAASLAATEDAAAAATTSTTPVSVDDGVTAGDAGLDEDSNALGTFDPEEPASERDVPALDGLQKAAPVMEETHPAVSFEDSLTVHTGSLGTDTSAAGIPDSSKLTVSVTAEAGTFPAGTTMVLSSVTDMDAVAEAVEGTVDGKTRGFQAVDISFRDKDGNEIEPLKPISVTMRSDSIKAATEDSSMAPVVVHVEDQSKKTVDAASDLVTTVMETLPSSADNNDNSEAHGIIDSSETITFKADSFSIYAIVYTVVIAAEDDGVYRFEGEDYTITITCPEEANIPVGTKLTVSELEPDSDEYIQRLGQAWYEVNREYFEVEEMRANYNEGMGDLPDLPLINLDHARFFNIRFVYEDREIEPDVPVQVEIAYDDGMTMAGEAVSGAVRYAKDAVELVDEVDVVTEGSDVRAFKYEQADISDTGTYVGQKTYDEIAEPVALPAPEPMQYPLLQTKKKAANALRGSGDGENEDDASENDGDEQLAKPKATKTLTPNQSNGINDGTYTLELAVDGHATSSTETTIKKSNVLIVMDRSSSMINNIGSSDVTQVAEYKNNRYYKPGSNSRWSPENGVTYYGMLYSNGEYRYRELFYSNGQFYYYDSQGVTTATTKNYTGNIYTSRTRTRLSEEQEALSTLIHDLLAKNGEGTTDDGVSLEDIVEISVISFAKDRMDQNDGAPHPSSEQDWSTKYDDLMDAVNDPYAPSGTNWEQALRYAMDEIAEKKADPKQAGEDYYLVFLTDGEPTATKAHHSNAYYYGSTERDYLPAYEAARDYVKDESGIADAADIHFYGIMTWATNDIMRGFLKRLVNVGNGNVSNEKDFTTEAVANYYFDADSLSKLEEAFRKIFSTVSESVAYEQVSITDGLTTDAMTTTLVNGSAKGFQYTVYRDRVVDADGKIVSKGTPVYTVTTTDGGDGPNVTFHIDGTDYKGDDVKKKAHVYNELQEDGTTLVPTTKYYYSVTVGEGENAREYKMTLADKTEGRLDWDLAAIGALEDGYTYAVSFTVWPDQDAYDYVAALNNGLKQIKNSQDETVGVDWDSRVETDANKVTDSKGKSYWKGGVPGYPSIIKYTDGTFAVLTNTDQSLKYTIAKTEKIDGNEPTVVYDGPYTSNLPTPDPMPLTGTASQLEKVWNINRDPRILYKYLYESKDEDGNPVAFDIGFEIDQDGEKYKEVNLPGKATVDENGVSYDWSAYKAEDLVEYNGKTFSKRWSQDFSIPTGLMLSEAQMDARGLDKSRYTDNYLVGTTRYYVLEPGHDFKITEPAVGYEFDFEEPTYHPMLVDGVLMDVKFTTEGGTRSISGMKALEIDTPTGKSALTVFNTLRGYINVRKKVVDSDGTTEITTDDTEFTFEVELTNALPVFEGDHIPWFGINGLYYHDAEADDKYYQAEYINGKLQVTTEEGGPYEGVGNTFNPDKAGEQTITYIVDGEEVSVKICGNQMTPDDGSEEEGYKKVTGTPKITRTETLYIANVPVNTHYTIRETGLAAQGYELIGIERQIGTGSPAPGAGNIENGIEGEIVQNTETLITYTNRCLVTDITIKKTDTDGKGLEGAVFQLKKQGLDGHSESDASLIESVSGLAEITKKVNGETKTYTSAIESNGGAQTIKGLPDGTYRLYEVVVPPGYINTYRYIQFAIEDRIIKNVSTDTGDTSKLDTTANNIDLKIANEPGVALPHTGGPGTRLFTLFGSFLILGAGALLWRKRRFI